MPGIIISDQDRQLFATDKYAFINKFTGLLAQNARITAPKVEILTIEEFKKQRLGSDGCNAFYNVKSGTIKTTSKFIDNFSPEEAIAVLGHELGHKIQYDKDNNVIMNLYCYASLFAKSMVGFSIGAYLLRARKIQPFLKRFAPEILPLIHKPPLAWIFGVSIAASTIFSKLCIWKSHKREYDCDRISAELTGHKQWKIDALKKILSTEKAGCKEENSTHPTTQHRIEALEKLQDPQ